MLKKYLAPLFVLSLIIAAVPERAVAQDASREIAETLSRLNNNPRYQGRVLGTHVRRDGARYLYEVRILRPDDRVILVYIDPETGGVVGDSERSISPPSSSRRQYQENSREKSNGRSSSGKRRNN